MCGETNLTNRLLSYKRKVFFPEHRLIGNAPTTKVEIDLYNEDNAITEALLQNQFIITEGSVTNGVFFVLEKPQKYTKKLSLELYDNMIKLDIPYKSQLDYEEGTTIRAQLNEMATLSGITITLSDLPEVVLNKTVGWIDTTYSIRTYVGWIAELAGMNAMCDYTGAVRFYDISNTNDYSTTDLSDYSTDELWTLGRVCFDDGLNVYSYPSTSEDNTLYITNTNLYFSNVTEVQFIYEKYEGFNVMISKDIKMPGIDSVRLGQIIRYNNDFNFIVLDLTSTYTGGSYCDHEISGELETKESEGTVVRYDDSVRVKKVQTVVDQVNNSLTIIAQDVEDEKSDISQMQVEVGSITSTVASVQEQQEQMQDNLESTNNTITTIQENVSSVQQTTTNIQTQVSQTQTDLQNNYATKSELSSSVTSLSSTISQTAENIELSITDVRTIINSQGTHITTLEKYLQMTSRGLELGERGEDASGVVAILTNTQLQFVDKANNKLAWLDSADGLGASGLSIGDANTASNRWRIFTRQSGSHLTFTRHS